MIKKLFPDCFPSLKILTIRFMVQRASLLFTVLRWRSVGNHRYFVNNNSIVLIELHLTPPVVKVFLHNCRERQSGIVGGLEDGLGGSRSETESAKETGLVFVGFAEVSRYSVFHPPVTSMVDVDNLIAEIIIFAATILGIS